MGRLFSYLLLSLMLLPAKGCREEIKPVFFSMLFPQLMPISQQEQIQEEAVFL